jgi:hypothetical protein
MVVAVNGSTNMLRSPRRVTAAESEQSGITLEDLERKLQIVAFYGSPTCALADKKNDQYFDGTLLRFIANLIMNQRLECRCLLASS